MRFWSPTAEPLGRMPGMTRTPSGPVRLRRVATSWGEQTKPWMPAPRPMLARRETCSAGERMMPTAAHWTESMLVRTVTARS